jgi:hypothetical protein
MTGGGQLLTGEKRVRLAPKVIGQDITETLQKKKKKRKRKESVAGMKEKNETLFFNYRNRVFSLS